MTNVASEHTSFSAVTVDKAIFLGLGVAQVQPHHSLYLLVHVAEATVGGALGLNGTIMKANTATNGYPTKLGVRSLKQYYNCDRHPYVVCLSLRTIRITNDSHIGIGAVHSRQRKTPAGGIPNGGF